MKQEAQLCQDSDGCNSTKKTTAKTDLIILSQEVIQFRLEEAILNLINNNNRIRVLSKEKQ